ncbi:hypothetical protein BH11MYX1_BH11MYX1_30850 [soil metagenome]
MRFAALFIVLLAAGCPGSAQDAAAEGGGLHGPGNDVSECRVDGDCAAAAAKCCDCPTYAAPNSDSSIDACAGVACPISTCPQNVRPACTEGRCELACVAMACSASCADGFVVDDNGCLTCECAQVQVRECIAPSDCRRVPADCCGCANGGLDTAVLAPNVASHQAGLGCPANPSCPAGDSCPAELTPACVQGVCDLDLPLPTAACGRPDLPGCPSGQVCTVNANSTASSHAVGVCVPAT